MRLAKIRTGIARLLCECVGPVVVSALIVVAELIPSAGEFCSLVLAIVLASFLFPFFKG